MKLAARITRAAAVALFTALASTQLSAGAVAQDYEPDTSAAARAQAGRAQAAQARAARAQMMRMKQAQAAQARAAQAGMAETMSAAAAMAANDSGECAPHFARWMMTRSPAARARYEACMDD